MLGRFCLYASRRDVLMHEKNYNEKKNQRVFIFVLCLPSVERRVIANDDAMCEGPHHETTRAHTILRVDDCKGKCYTFSTFKDTTLLSEDSEVTSSRQIVFKQVFTSDCEIKIIETNINKLKLKCRQ